MGPVRKPILHKFLNFYIKFGNLLFPEYPFTSYENADAVCVGGREAAAPGQADANPVENHRPHRGQDSRSVPGEVNRSMSNVSFCSKNSPVLWIRNNLLPFRIQLRIFQTRILSMVFKHM